MSIAARRLQRVSSGTPNAPKLYTSPASSTVSNGATVVVTIYEDSYSQAVNSVQANLTYPTNRFTFQSISTTSSAFSTVIQTDGGGGTVQIGVGILGGSVTGNQEVARVTFTANATGSANVAFDTGSGIARESDSTDICQVKTGSTFTIQ